jgi:hypothetical protein
VGLAATVPERSRAVRSVLQPGQKIPRSPKRLRSQGWLQFGPVLRGETPAIHVMFWRNTTKNSRATYYLIFLRFRGWWTMCGHRSHPSFWSMLPSNFRRLESLLRTEVILAPAGRC